MNCVVTGSQGNEVPKTFAGTGFADDTVVHVETANFVGNKLRLIENIEVGDKVLSRCEKTGEIAYKWVTKVFAHGFAHVYGIACKYGPEIDPEFGHTYGLVHVTGEHPFWVQEKGWVKVRDLQIGDVLSTHDGVHAELELIYKVTRYECEVFDLEVKDFHTYFVHWSGLWVHNKKSAGVSTLPAEARTKHACFDGETVVHARLNEKTYELMKQFIRSDRDRPIDIGVPLRFEIWHLKPGVEVLSRCEKTGDIAYKRITKVFEHESQKVCELSYYSERLGRDTSVLATENHPFWVTGKGWVNAGDLKPGDRFENFEGGGAEFQGLKKDRYTVPVYNIEVEDFHTYFVEDGILVHNKNQEEQVSAPAPAPSRWRRAVARTALLLSFAATGHFASAQSLPELYTQALALDPAVAGAQAQVHAAEQRQFQARVGFGPTAAMVGNYSETRYREAPEYEQRKFQGKQLNFQITQPLLRSALLPALDSAEAQLFQAQAALEQARADSAQRLVEACFEVLKARDALELARAQRVSTAEQLVLAQRSFKIGTVPIIDVREAEAKADAVAAQVSAAEFDLDLKLQIVSELTGRTASALLSRGLDGKQLPPLQADSASVWLAVAQDNSAQLQQARQALIAAEAEVNKAWHGHAPTADLTYTYGHSSDTGTVTSIFPRRGNSSTVGVNLNIPLFASGATHSKVKEARALRDKAQSDVDAARRTVNLGVRQNASATLSAISQVHGLEAAVRSQELAFRANRRGYEVGMKVNAEVLDSQSRLFEARRDLSRARYDAWVSYIKLKALAGRLDESDIWTLEDLLVPVEQADMRRPNRLQ